MKKVCNISLLLLLCFSLVSCTTLGMLSEEEKKVKVAFSKRLVENCQFIDSFMVGSVVNPNAAIRKKAFKMGGDRVLVHKERRSVDVEVYRCSEQPPQMEESVQAETESQEPVSSPE